MSDITESDLDVLRDRLPPVVDAFEHFTYIGSGTFSKVYMANIRVSFLSKNDFNNFPFARNDRAAKWRSRWSRPHRTHRVFSAKLTFSACQVLYGLFKSSFKSLFKTAKTISSRFWPLLFIPSVAPVQLWCPLSSIVLLASITIRFEFV